MCQRGDAIFYEAAYVILNRNAAYFGKALVYLQVTAVWGQAGEAYGSGVVNELQRRLVWKQHHI
jgi:hypothetical protein